MDSRYGLLVAVGAIFVGVITVAILRLPTHDDGRWPIKVCGEIHTIAEDTRAATSQSVDERAAVLATLNYISKKHCL
jgi:hypothetical protein